MSVGQVIAIVGAIGIMYVLVRYGGGLKNIALGLFFSFGLGLVSYWIVDFIIKIPSFIIPIFMLAWLIFNLMYHKKDE